MRPKPNPWAVGAFLLLVAAPAVSVGEEWSEPPPPQEGYNYNIARMSCSPPGAVTYSKSCPNFRWVVAQYRCADGRWTVLRSNIGANCRSIPRLDGGAPIGSRPRSRPPRNLANCHRHPNGSYTC